MSTQTSSFNTHKKGTLKKKEKKKNEGEHVIPVIRDTI